jgi:hypothetical protein
MGPMVELLPERQRAERFARALDGHAAPTDARLQEALDTAARLAAVPLVQPREEFRDSLRSRLMEAAAAELPVTVTAPPGHPGRHAVVREDPGATRRRRRLVAVATGLVLIGGGTGVAAASEQALPGDVLYPVKRTVETAQVGLARGDAAEGRALLERADTRLDEVQALNADLAVEGNDPDGNGLAGVESALDDFAVDASTGGSRLLRSYSESRDPADLRTLRGFTADAHEVLGGLAVTLPPEAQESVAAADDALVALDDMARRACPGCTSAPPLQGLPAAPVAQPDAAQVTPDLPAPTRSRPIRHRRAGGTGQRADDPARRQPAILPSDLPALPDLDLGGTAGPQPRQQGTAPDGDGGSGAQGSPRLGLDDLLGPQPPQRTVDAPLPRRLPGDLDGVTEPLTDPLPSLLGGAGDTVDDTRDGLGGLLQP